MAVVMAPGLRFDSPAARAALRWLAWIAAALGAFTILLLVEGKNPAVAFFDIVQNTLGSRYGLSEVVVKMSPLLLVALAVTIPARVGLVNVGGEGQMFIGAMCASWAALSFTRLPAWLLLPLMVLLGFVGGGLWAGVAGFLRARGWLTEVFSTMLLNYLGILVVSVLVFGPWRDPTSSNYPQSREFVHAARLPSFAGTRMHLGIVFGVVALVLFDLFLTRTRWGLEMRAIGGNPNAAARSGIPVLRYMVLAMVVGGGLAGIAGMAQVSAVQFRLNPGVSAGFGYVGFLISWLAGHRPRALIPVVFLLAVLAAGGDILQITQGIPYAAVNVLMALILIAVLAARAVRRGVAT